MSLPCLIAAIGILAAATDVSAWAAPAHQAIADLAQARIGPAARKALAQILGAPGDLPSGALADLAAWPDEIRRRQSDGTVADGWTRADVREADRFNRDHPKNGLWHFVNLPLGADEYPVEGTAAWNRLQAFVSAHDIVHALAASIRILESPTPPTDFSKPQALSWLVHLVGDIHQPMHVTAGYYDAHAPDFATAPVRIEDPQRAAAAGVLGDRGGNGLLFAPSPSIAGPKNLHAIWDSCVPAVVASARCDRPSQIQTALVRTLGARLAPAMVAEARTPGDHHIWPAAWASDTLRRAAVNRVYDVRLTAGRIDVSSGRSVQATVTAPGADAYARQHAAAAAAQLSKAAIRLADLLDAIGWP